MVTQFIQYAFKPLLSAQFLFTRMTFSATFQVSVKKSQNETVRFISIVLVSLGLLWPFTFANAIDIDPASIHFSKLDQFNQVQDYIQMEQKLEKAVELDPQLNKQAPLVAKNLADIYLKNGRVQEAIWALEKGGLFFESEELIQFIQNRLKSEKVIVGERVGIGVTRPQYGQIGGLQVIMKEFDKKSSIESEIWAYQLDRALGLNLIPIAIERIIDGQRNSVHLYLHSSKKTGLDFVLSPYQKHHADLYLLDFLLGQKDRHSGNSLYSVSGKMVAIDHGRIYGYDGETTEMVNTFYDKRLIPQNRILTNLINTDPLILYYLLEKYSNPDVATFILKQFDKVRSLLPSPAAPTKFRAMLPEERASKDSVGFDLSKIKNGLVASRDVEFYQKLNDIDKLGKMTAPQEFLGFITHSENAKVMSGLIETNRIFSSGRYSAQIFDKIISMYDRQALLATDVQSLFHYIIQDKLDPKSINLIREKSSSLGPLKEILNDNKFVLIFSNSARYSAQFIENYNFIRSSNFKALQCHQVFL